MPQCSAFKCKNRGVHLFPKDPKRRKQWETALRIKNFRASATAQLCRSHFKESDYYGISKYTNNEPVAKFLIKTAVPSIFCFTKIKPETPATLERQRRFEKRSETKPVPDKTLQFSTASTSKEDKKDLVAPAEDQDEEITFIYVCAGPDTLVPDYIAFTEPEYSCKSTQVDHEHVYGSVNRFKEDDKAIKFYTGFETYKKFHFVFSTLSPMAHKIRYYCSKVVTVSLEDQFFMTMMKLKQNKCIYELSKFFCISETTVSNIFLTWINFIYQQWSTMNIWPGKESVEYYMPDHFKTYDQTKGNKLDGTEIPVQEAKTPIFLNSELPVLSLIKDRQLNKVIPQTDTVATQLPGLSLIKDRKLDNKHRIERLIWLTKTYKILKFKLDHSYIPIANKIFFICFMCCNFTECIMKKNKDMR